MSIHTATKQIKKVMVVMNIRLAQTVVRMTMRSSTLSKCVVAVEEEDSVTSFFVNLPGFTSYSLSHIYFNARTFVFRLSLNLLEFTWRANATCLGNVLEGFSSLPSAKDGCKDDQNCNGIFDVGCDNKLFWTCHGKIAPGKHEIAKKSCAWNKGNF